MTRREEAALRVRDLHPPLPVLFARLREEHGEPPAPPAPEPPPPPPAAPADPLLDLLRAAAREAEGDTDDVAFALAVALDDELGPSDLDAVLGALRPYANAVAVARAAGREAPDPADALAEQVRAAARRG